MADVARELSRDRGVLEPLQTAKTVDGQVLELRGILENHGRIPLNLVGHSWGAWLSFILAARNPGLVKKLILVGSGPFRETDARDIADTRLKRLDGESRNEALGLMNRLQSQFEEKKDEVLARLATLFYRADSFDPMDYNHKQLNVSYEIYRSVWPEASKMRAGGELLELGKQIRCPVLALHGDYDPHPAEGVEVPLKNLLNEFTMVRIGKCGHSPWMEKQARDAFYDILKKNLN
jgi:pimeloyl-ACP methyl ester carboxylesterase